MSQVIDRSGEPPEPADQDQERWRRDYWQRNLRLMVSLLAVWFFVSYGLGILLAEQMNRFVVNGFPLGFWFAQQGSIITFVVLILIYAVRMDRLDDEYGVSERDEGGRRL